MTEAETLCAAAAKLREVGGKATHSIGPEWTYSAVRHIARNCDITCSHTNYGDGPFDLDDGLNHDGWDRYEDSPWLTLAHPGLAEPLAAWLEDAARDWGYGVRRKDELAVTVARTLVGTT